MLQPCAVSAEQSAAIPYRIVDGARVEVMLVTSRRRGRWVLPKGKVKQGMLPHRSAKQEAFEEAGVLGEIETVPVGSYRQRKVSADGKDIEVAVQAFAMRVTDEQRSWPEMRERKRSWMPLADAIQTIRDAEIRSLLATFGKAIAL